MLRLKKYRTAAGYSQKALADAVGVTEVTILRWEKQLSKPNTKYLPKLCKVLNVEIGELLTVKEE